MILFDIHKNIEIKNVASRYIDSCTTMRHIKTMRRYLDIYKNECEDFIGHHYLERQLDEKEEEIKSKLK